MLKKIRNYVKPRSAKSNQYLFGKEYRGLKVIYLYSMRGETYVSPHGESRMLKNYVIYYAKTLWVILNNNLTYAQRIRCIIQSDSKCFISADADVISWKKRNRLFHTYICRYIHIYLDTYIHVYIHTYI